MTKKIAIMTTGGDCSGLNSVVRRLAVAGISRGHKMIGILDGTDGLSRENAPHFIEFDYNTLPAENARLSGSYLRNGNSHSLNFETAAKSGQHEIFSARMKKAMAILGLDAMILVGGNGSLSMANKTRALYSDLQLIGIPKTIDMDIPLTDTTIGFATAVQQLAGFCDQLILTARSHHRWFIVQTMGRNVGMLALSAGIAAGADAILMPEIKFVPENLAAHCEKIQTGQGRDYGIIIVAEGIRIRGHSGEPAEIISRLLKKRDIHNRVSFPEHIQRAGDTTAPDRILAAQMADCALAAIENNETNMMVAIRDGVCKTVSLADMFAAGDIKPDPNIPGLSVSDALVPPDHPLLSVAMNMGIYIGERK
ncbi:MAG: 6-phosphofructokinase [Proteobacteria bacterium]|nr:6-phosphofructokinase [Pseudomonadota bacterium]